jgi:hypothetical protein
VPQTVASSLDAALFWDLGNIQVLEMQQQLTSLQHFIIQIHVVAQLDSLI